MVSTANVFALPAMGDDLDRVRSLLDESVQSPDSLLTEISAHLLDATGPRLRSALALTSAAIGDDESAPASLAAIRGATSVELVHIGSTYHDDVIDRADTRDGIRSVNATWGELHAILAGDFLLARSAELAALLGTEVAGLLAQTIGRICEGQVSELSAAHDVNRTIDAYLASVDGKTAALMASSCRIGALAGERPRPVVDALTTYGHRFGMATQIAGDVLDIVTADSTADDDDLAGGNYTLAVLRALGGQHGADIRQLLESGPDGVSAAREAIRSNGTMTETLPLLSSYIDEALDALDAIEDGPRRSALATTASELMETASNAVA